MKKLILVMIFVLMFSSVGFAQLTKGTEVIVFETDGSKVIQKCIRGLLWQFTLRKADRIDFWRVTDSKQVYIGIKNISYSAPYGHVGYRIDTIPLKCK